MNKYKHTITPSLDVKKIIILKKKLKSGKIRSNLEIVFNYLTSIDHLKICFSIMGLKQQQFQEPEPLTYLKYITGSRKSYYLRII